MIMRSGVLLSLGLPLKYVEVGVILLHKKIKCCFHNLIDQDEYFADASCRFSSHFND